MSARSSSQESDPGYVMRPPSLGHYQSQPSSLSISNDSTNNTVNLKFTKNRSRTKKCGRLLMYLGYLQMVLDLVGVVFIVVELVNYGKSRRHLSRRRQHFEDK